MTTVAFLRPVFTGERIDCDVTITKVEPGEGRTNAAFSMVCRNPQGKEVMRGHTAGIIRT
jgi:acyl dehydratase